MIRILLLLVLHCPPLLAFGQYIPTEHKYKVQKDSIATSGIHVIWEHHFFYVDGEASKKKFSFDKQGNLLEEAVFDTITDEQPIRVESYMPGTTNISLLFKRDYNYKEWERGLFQQWSYDFDSTGNPVKILQIGITGLIEAADSLVYDKNGRLISFQILPLKNVFMPIGSPDKWTFSYNHAGQLNEKIAWSRLNWKNKQCVELITYHYNDSGLRVLERYSSPCDTSRVYKEFRHTYKNGKLIVTEHFNTYHKKRKKIVYACSTIRYEYDNRGNLKSEITYLEGREEPILGIYYFYEYYE